MTAPGVPALPDRMPPRAPVTWRGVITPINTPHIGRDGLPVTLRHDVRDGSPVILRDDGAARLPWPLYPYPGALESVGEVTAAWIEPAGAAGAELVGVGTVAGELARVLSLGSCVAVHAYVSGEVTVTDGPVIELDDWRVCCLVADRDNTGPGRIHATEPEAHT